MHYDLCCCFWYVSDADSHEVLSNDKSDGVKRRRMQVDILGTKVDSPTSSICDKIVVTGLSKNTDNDLIRLFFGNKRRTGGGPVSSVNRIGKTCAAVEFESAEGVWNSNPCQCKYIA